MNDRLARVAPASTAALTLVTVTLAASIGRLFIDGAAVVGDLVIVALVAHGAAAAGRAANLRLRWALTLSIGASITALGWLHYPDAGWLAMFRPSTYRTAGSDISASLEPLRTLVAPVEQAVGFDVMLGIVVAVIATFADAAAFRASARFQAVVPHLALFVYGAVLARGASATAASVAFGASLVLWGALSQSVGAGALGKRPAWNAVGPALAVIAVGALLAGMLPSASGTGVVDLRAIGRPPSPRTIVTPLVGIGSSLGPLSDTEMFTVSSPAPHYWRLTTLEDFDGATWTSTARYEDVTGAELERSTPAAVPTTTESLRVTIASLSSDWVPTAHEVTAADSDVGLRYDTDSSSLFYDAENGGTPGTEIALTSAVPQYSEDTGTSTDRDVSLPNAGDYLEVPNQAMGAELASRMRQIDGLSDFDSLSNVELAQRLQDWFRSEFTYELDVNYQRSADPIDAFLRQRQGFCQQFATTFAAMTRAAGIATRVAVGFTYGDESVDENGDRQWTVRGRHAHAWPEIWTEDLGWVAFEPTPGRGNPDTVTQTGVPAGQAAAGGGTETQPAEVPDTTTSAPTTTAAAATPTTQPGTTVAPQAATTAAQSDTNVPVTLLTAVGVIAVAIGGWIALVAARRRRRRANASTDELVRLEWDTATRDLRAVGLLQSPDETPLEFANRAASDLPLAQLIELGDLESRRRFAAASLTPQEAQRASAIADDVVSAVSQRTGPTTTVRRMLRTK